MSARFTILIILTFHGFSALNAQQETIFRLRTELGTVHDDVRKFQILDSLSMNYLFFTTKQDSSYFFINESINEAFNKTDKRPLILAYARMGFYFVVTSQLKAALDISLKGLALSDDGKINDYLSTLDYNMAWVYGNFGDPAVELKYDNLAIRSMDGNKDPYLDIAVHVYGQMGDNCLDREKNDSAFYYFNLTQSLALQSKELTAMDVANWYLGMYYLQLGKLEAADSILSFGLVKCRAINDYQLLNVFHLFLAYTFFGQNRIRPAIANAKMAMAISDSADDLGDELGAAGLLQQCYDKLKMNDSAYYFIRFRDSLHRVTKIDETNKQVQQAEFDQEIRQKENEANKVLENERERNKIRLYVFLTALASFLVIVAIQWRNNRNRKRTNQILEQQKKEIQSTLQELKASQAQLVQSEKMASLGELTAGIAHEIQNPLNFVNNFSDLNKELLEEMKQSLQSGNTREAAELAEDLQGNMDKINEHGKRADSIVKAMLQHSRVGTGQKEPTDINALCEEYLKLSYHGMRAKDKEFNVSMKTDFDKSMGRIDIIPQDIGRVLLNLYNNAFYSVREKAKKNINGYQPAVSVKSEGSDHSIKITVEDNGTGIPDKIRDKIFQPFFTTKPSGQGTGLGLSLSYDIIKAHGGDIILKSVEGQGSAFIIQLPIASMGSS